MSYTCLTKEIRVGDVIEFVYLGGSRLGEWRKSEVKEIRDDRMVCVDGGDDVPRQYLFDKMDRVKKVDHIMTTMEKEILEVESFLDKFPSYALSVVGDFNKKYGTSYEFKDCM